MESIPNKQFVDDQPPSGEPRRKTNPIRASRREVAARVETIRQLMAAGVIERDIVRQCVEKWQLDSRTVREWYLGKARKVFRERAGLTREEAKGQSLDLWSSRLQKMISREVVVEKEMEQAIKRLRLIESQFDNAESDEGRLACSNEMLRLQRDIGRLQTELGSVRHNVHAVADRRDRIYGTYAPAKIAETDADGNNVQRTPAQIAVSLHQLGVNLPALPADDPKLIEVVAERNSVEMPE